MVFLNYFVLVFIFFGGGRGAGEWSPGRLGVISPPASSSPPPLKKKMKTFSEFLSLRRKLQVLPYVNSWNGNGAHFGVKNSRLRRARKLLLLTSCLGTPGSSPYWANTGRGRTRFLFPYTHTHTHTHTHTPPPFLLTVAHLLGSNVFLSSP